MDFVVEFLCLQLPAKVKADPRRTSVEFLHSRAYPSDEVVGIQWGETIWWASVMLPPCIKWFPHNSCHSFPTTKYAAQ